MNKKGLLLSVLLLLMSVSAFGQWNRFNFNGGFVYEFIRQKQKNVPNPFVRDYPFYGLEIGGNYVIAHSNDVLSLNLNPAGRFAFSFSNVFGSRLMAQAPIFLIGRFGAGATTFNEQKVGIGLGAGASYTYIYSRESQTVTLKQGFVVPNALVELSINNGGSVYRIRVHWALTSDEHEWLGSDWDYSNFGLGIVYTF